MQNTRSITPHRQQYGRINAGSVIAIVLATGLCLGATALIRANAEEKATPTKTPLPVSVIEYTVEQNYDRRADFVGVIRAGSDSAVGFEVAGTIENMPAREGARVNAGDIIAVLDSDRRIAQLRAAEAELTQLNVQLELSRLRRDRIAKLAERKLASQQEYDEALLNERALVASQSAVEARRDSARLEIEKSTLLAPFDGVVAARLVQEGAVVGAGAPVIRLVASSGFEAHVGIPIDLGARLDSGDNYTLTAGERSLRGKLRAIRTDVDPTTLTVGAVFEVAPGEPVYPGESVVLKLTERVTATGGWLPLSALLEGDRGLWNVLVLSEDGETTTTVRESVEIIYAHDGEVFVRGTLADGAQVISTGLQRLSPGNAVTALLSEQ